MWFTGRQDIRSGCPSECATSWEDHHNMPRTLACFSERICFKTMSCLFLDFYSEYFQAMIDFRSSKLCKACFSKAVCYLVSSQRTESSDTDNTKLLHLSIIHAPVFFPTAFFTGFVNELIEPGPQMCGAKASSLSHTLRLCLVHAYKQQSVSWCLSFYLVFLL